MRAVVDTNVLISGLLWRGRPHTLLERARAGSFVLIISAPLIDELSDVLRRRKFQAILARSDVSPQRIVREVTRLAEVVEAWPLTNQISRDRDDDAVIAAAVVGRADLIVSGDRDLLTIGAYAGIRIVTPGEALRLVPG